MSVSVLEMRVDLVSDLRECYENITAVIVLGTSWHTALRIFEKNKEKFIDICISL